jgi:hypothetical protein
MPTDERLAVDLIGRTDYGRVATGMRALPFLAFARHIVATAVCCCACPAAVDTTTPVPAASSRTAPTT